MQYRGGEEGDLIHVFIPFFKGGRGTAVAPADRVTRAAAGWRNPSPAPPTAG